MLLLLVLVVGPIWIYQHRHRLPWHRPRPTGNVHASLYSIPGCYHCDVMRKWLQSRKVGFDEVDMSDGPREVLTHLYQVCPNQRVIPLLELGGKCLTPPLDESAADDLLADTANSKNIPR